MELNNAVTKGTKIINSLQGYDRSSLMIPMNEDYAIVVKIDSYSAGSGLVSGRKVWDEGNTTYYAIVKYQGRSGVPKTEEVEPNSYTVFYRVGDFTSQGTGGFELHEENPSFCSWVCFIPFIEEI
jgi:hypothetical protein